MPASISSRCSAEPDRGVSELIGAILMISIVVAAVAIIGVILVSQATPQKIPNVNFMTGSDNSGNIYLLHNGGDTLVRGCFTVVVDNKIRDDFKIPDGDPNVWSFGKNLVISLPPSSTPHTIALTYNATGGPVVISSANSSVMTSTTLISNPNYVAVTAYPPVASVPVLMQNLTNSSVIFYRENNAQISQSANTYFNFTITTRNSTITTNACGTNPYIFSIGDILLITQSDSITQGFRMAGIGNQIWELSADKVDVTIRNSAGVVQCNLNGAKINDTLITGYNNTRTNFTIKSGSASSFTTLTKYNYMTNILPQNTSWLIRSPYANPIVINNISPGRAGFFVFQFDNATKGVYFAGNITGGTYGVNQIYP
jgi:hypothetical protein